MSTPKRQHWVPRFYLRHFTVTDRASPTEQVWIFHRKEGEPRLTSINNIALENHLYSPKRPDGTRDPRLETKLARLEGTLSKFWPKLGSGFIDLGSDSVRKAISLFLSVQFLRHPERRDSDLNSRRRLLEQIEHTPKGDIDQPAIGKIHMVADESTLDRSPLASNRDSPNEPSNERWLEAIERDAVRYAKMLMKKRWSIVFIDEPLFVTSDYPIFVPEPERERYQIAAQGAVILFPISPTRILSFDDLDAPANRYHHLDCADAHLYNLLTWVNTESFMISPRNVFDVLEGMERLKNEFAQQVGK